MADTIRPEHRRYEERYRAIYAAGVPFMTADREKERLAHFREFLEGRKGRGRLIDFGCGEGFPAMMAAEMGYKVVGIDSAPSAIEKCRETHNHPHFEVIHADVCELGSMPSESFEVAVDLGCFHVLVEDEDARRYLGESFRLLKAGGVWYGQNLVPAEDAEASCPQERELVEWWRKRIAEPDDGSPIREIFEVEGRTVEVERARTPAAHRGVAEQVSLLTAVGFGVDSAQVVTPGVNSPFEARLIGRKPPE